MATFNISNSIFNSKSSFTDAQAIKTFMELYAEHKEVSGSCLQRKINRFYFQHKYDFDLDTIDTENFTAIQEIVNNLLEIDIVNSIQNNQLSPTDLYVSEQQPTQRLKKIIYALGTKLMLLFTNG